MRRSWYFLLATIIPLAAYARSGLPSHNPSHLITGQSVAAPCTPITVTPPCDAIGTNCTFAYGFRKLKGAFGGSPINVKRASDGTTSDIGFCSASDSLDTGALAAFCASTSCQVVKFYDQSGGGHDLISSSGWAIYTTGSVSATINGLPVMRSPGIGSYNAYNSVATFTYCATTTCTWFGVGAYSGQNGSPSACAFSGNIWSSLDQMYMMGVNPANNACASTNDTGNAAAKAYTYNTADIFTMRFSTSDSPKLKVYVAGGTPGTSNPTGVITITGNPQLGQTDASTSQSPVPIGGLFAEWLGWTTELNASDSNTIGANQNTYWATGWSNIS